MPLELPGKVLTASRQTLSRITDSERWPRRLWAPHPLEANKGHMTTRERVHDDVSRKVGRAMITLVGYSFFCILTLSAPDYSLLSRSATIKVPFADVEISYVAFLIIGPVLLGVLTFYMQLFLGRHLALRSLHRDQMIATIANLRNPIARLTSFFVSYWLAPGVLVYFVWKALPREELPYLVLGSSLGTLILVFLQIRRFRNPVRRYANPFLWIIFFLVVVIAISCCWKLADKEEFPGSDFPIFGSLFTRAYQLSMADLSNEDLRGLDLRRADLTEVNLSGANLRQAILSEAVLIGANLSHGRLRRTDLRGTNLNSAKLYGAQLEGADLRDVNLSHASLKGARLGCDELFGATLVCTDLRGVKGIQSCDQLLEARGLEQSYRDEAWACGRPTPTPPFERATPSNGRRL